MRRKQLSFDIDTKVAKAILGKNNYIKAYLDVRKFLEKEGWEHPYLTKCFREIHQADVCK